MRNSGAAAAAAVASCRLRAGVEEGQQVRAASRRGSIVVGQDRGPPDQCSLAGVLKIKLPRFVATYDYEACLRRRGTFSPVAAAATEFRLNGQGDTQRDIIPSKDHKCFVRLHGDLIVTYRLRAVGGPKRPTLLHQEPPRRSDKLFELFDTDAFFHSYLACHDVIHQMLAQTPPVGEFDLAPDNWDDFLPHDLAMLMVRAVRHDTDEHGGVTLRYNVDMDLTITVDIVYSEPKALLLATVTRCLFEATPTDCCVCMEDFTATKGSDTTVRLPCSHTFHRGCILPWFYKAATCPKCRHGLGKYLVAAIDTRSSPASPNLPDRTEGVPRINNCI